MQTIVKDVYEQSKQDLRDDINTVTLVCKNKLESLTQVLQQVNSKFTDLEKTMDVRVGAMEKTVSDHCQRILQLESSKILPNYEALKAGNYNTLSSHKLSGICGLLNMYNTKLSF